MVSMLELKPYLWEGIVALVQSVVQGADAAVRRPMRAHGLSLSLQMDNPESPMSF